MFKNLTIWIIVSQLTEIKHIQNLKGYQRPSLAVLPLQEEDFHHPKHSPELDCQAKKYCTYNKPSRHTSHILKFLNKTTQKVQICDIRFVIA